MPQFLSACSTQFSLDLVCPDSVVCYTLLLLIAQMIFVRCGWNSVIRLSVWQINKAVIRQGLSCFCTMLRCPRQAYWSVVGWFPGLRFHTRWRVSSGV